MKQEVIQVDPKTIVCLAQVRTVFCPKKLAELAASIREVGIQQPLLLRKDGAQLILLDGERRLRAALDVGLTSVPAIVMDQPLDEDAIVQRQLIANLQRADLSPLEQAESMDQLMRLRGCSCAQAAALVGMSAGNASKVLSLLKLSPELKAQVAAGNIGLKEGYRLARGGNATAATDANAKSGNNSRFTAMLDRVRSVTVTGIENKIEAFIHAVEDVLNRMRKAAREGISLETLLMMMRDQARR